MWLVATMLNSTARVLYKTGQQYANERYLSLLQFQSYIKTYL